MSKARRPGSMFTTAAAAAAIFAVLLVVLLIKLASSGSVKSQLGSQTFLAGRATLYAPQIAAQGPFLLPDLVGSNRPLYLQHLGPDPKLGWVAIQAIPPGGLRTCVVQWRPDTHTFRNPCGAEVYPPDGTGLIRYPAVVLPSGRINVDLRTALASDTTITTGTEPPK
jgi:hypothetical protein